MFADAVPLQTGPLLKGIVARHMDVVLKEKCLKEGVHWQMDSRSINRRSKARADHADPPH